MEIHLFTTNDIEQKLHAVENTLTVLDYAIQGLKAEYTDKTFDSFDTIITDARQRVQEMHQSMQPISLDWEPEKLMILCECEVSK